MGYTTRLGSSPHAQGEVDDMSTGTLVLDVVCGMRIYAHDVVATSEHHGDTYYFCAKSCKQRFDAEPERFVPATAS